MRYINAKTILQPSNNFNVYRGCSHGCIYCDARSTCYQIGDFENIAVKKDALAIFEKDLLKRRTKAFLSTGAMGDPYIPLEDRLRLMEGVLKLIHQHGFGIAVQTKSTRILRDIELYEKINQRAKVIVEFTLTSCDDALCKQIEPAVSPPSERIAALHEFKEKGITTGVWLAPVLPFICDNEKNILEIVEACHKAGVSYIVNHGMMTTMREGSRDYFYEKLDSQFPGLRKRYEDTYKDRYLCPSPRAKSLQDYFESLCEQYGILTDHKAIGRLHTLPKHHQLSLF